MSTANTEPDAPRGTLLAPLLWAIYLASSWTWCIGMCMPALLARDFGLAGFLVFAVPNAIGAAAMGWVLASPEAAVRFARTHVHAARAFSLVTIAYQAYFLGVLLTFFPGVHAAWLGGLFALALLPWVFVRSIGRALTLSAAAYAVSLAAAGVLALRGGLDWSDNAQGAFATGLLWLAPVSVFGFALCPYLDLTFLRARASLSPNAGRAAFALGFLVLFFAMIVVTYLARGPLIAGFAVGAVLLVLALPYAVHVVCQLACTIGLHARELDSASGVGAAGRRPVRLGMVVGFALVGAAAALGPTVLGMDTREIGYRVFLSAYGVLFPAYVWLLAIPTRDGHRGIGGPLGRRKLRVWLGAVAIATPAFAMGFLAREEAYLIPGILVLLLSRLALPRPRIC